MIVLSILFWHPLPDSLLGSRHDYFPTGHPPHAISHDVPSFSFSLPVFSVHPPYLSEKSVLEAPTCCAETTSYSTSSQNVQSLRVSLVTFTWEGGCHIFSSTLTPVHSRDNDFHRNYSDDHPFSGGLHHTFKNGRILSVETRRTPVAPHHHWWRLQYRIIGTRMEAKKSMHIQPPAESAYASTCLFRISLPNTPTSAQHPVSAEYVLHQMISSCTFLHSVSRFSSSTSPVSSHSSFYFSCAYRPALFGAMCMLCYFMKHQRELLRLLLQLLPFFIVIIVTSAILLICFSMI